MFLHQFFACCEKISALQPREYRCRVLKQAQETRKRARPFSPEQWFEERELGKKAEFERQKTIAKLRVKLMHSPLVRV
jgi:hypothetical protein